jgi:hypothetical protein
MKKILLMLFVVGLLLVGSVNAQLSTGDIPANELPPGLWPTIEWVDPYPGQWQTIDVTTRGVIPDDGLNDVTAINSLLSAINAPTILYFPEGTYNFNSGQLGKKSDIIYKGAGTDKTTFLLENNASGLVWYGSNPGVTVAVTADTPAYSNIIPVASVSGYKIGDIVRIYQLYDAGEGLKESWGGVYRIMAVNANSIVTDVPVGLPLTVSKNPVVREMDVLRNIGIENIKFIRTSYSGGSTITFGRVYNAYVKNVESHNTAKHHVYATYSNNIIVTDSYFNGSQFGGTGGFAYGVLGELSTRLKVENNIMKDLRHPSVVQVGTSYYIYAYNFHYDTPREICWYEKPAPSWCGSATQIREMWNSWREIDVSVHGNYPHNNLWEGNVLYVPGIDRSHGEDGPMNTFFRNREYGQPTSYSWLPGVGIFRQVENEDQNIIGNVMLNNATLYIRYPTGDERAFVAGNVQQGQILWGALPVNAQLPPSLYLSSKPSWWNDAPWPAFGPDVQTTASNKIPAQVRWEQMNGAVTYHPADLNTDGCIDLGEISEYVGLWLNGKVKLADVSGAVGTWMGGC